MALKADLESRVTEVLSVAWDIRDGQVVPTTDDVKLSNGAVKLEAAYLYADLADSTTLARDFDRRTTARAVRAYLSVMSRLITAHDGEIRSFDGDRVMGIFIGGSKRSNAAKCCLKMNWAFREIVRSKFQAKHPAVKAKGYTLEHAAGVDMGEVLVVRAGVRGSNDLISIGAAPNLAARLSDIREAPYRSFLTAAVYDGLSAETKFAGNGSGSNMWEERSLTVRSRKMSVYRSSYHWSIA